MQMCHWHAGACNIAECMKPVADLVRWTVPTGRNVAKKCHGVDKGWVAHVVTNPFGYAWPTVHPTHGYVPGCSAWLMQTVWECYAFTMDKEYLREVWPLFVESGEFWLHWLVKNPETGKLVSGPASSPETGFKMPDGTSVGPSMGPAYDQECVWELFTEILEGAKALEIEDDFVKRVREALANLQMPVISKVDGSLLEFAKEEYKGNDEHRHRSHLVGLFPGRMFTSEHTLELFKAAGKALDRKMSGVNNTTVYPPWTPSWDIAMYARLRNPEKAMANLRTLFSGSRIHPNMLTRGGGEFQLDANTGLSAGVAEMLLQSHAGHIELLPCLPKEWPNGSVSGIAARGAFEVDMEWKAGKLVSASLLSRCGGKCKVRYNEVTTELDTEKGKSYDLSEGLKLKKYKVSRKETYKL